MAKVYNIMDRLVNVKPTLKIDEEHEYKINNTKNNAVYIQSLFSNINNKKKNKSKEVDEFEALDKIIKASLGKDAFDYIESLNLSLKGYTTIVEAIMAGIQNVELEDIEEEDNKARENFRKEKEETMV